MVTKKQYETIGLIGMGVLVIYFLISVWIMEYWYIRLGMGLITIYTVFFMLRMKFNKIVILAISLFMVLSIIFYHGVRGF